MTKSDFYELVMQAYLPAEALIRMAPPDKLDWSPGPTFMTLGQVICHLASGLGSDLHCLVTGDWPQPGEMTEAMKLENLPTCTVDEAVASLEHDKTTLRETLDRISEEDFTHKVVSVPWGWQARMERMLVLFREHFTNHKMQLFLYLKLLGLPVNTETLYGA